MKSMKWLFVFALSFMLIFTSQITPTQAATITKGHHIVRTAEHYIGTPYRFGAPYGTSRVFDCSSFTKYVFAKNGIYLPRTARAQSRIGHYVSRRNLRAGDLVFFSTPHKRYISHVGIYIGNGRFIHTYARHIGVTISSLNSRWWSSHYITARRVG